MATWGNTQMVCCTCRYWGGRRDIDFSASFFTAIDNEGKCNGPDNSFRSVIMNEGGSCNAWEPFRES